MRIWESYKGRYWFFAALWGAVLLLQAALTPIHADEAYYWMYAQQLDWGYFDHPPLVAIFIWLGEWLLPGTLGVRLITVLAHVLTLRILWALGSRHSDRHYLWSFWLLAFLLPMFHIYGFITTPDAPLLLTGALFLYAYKRVLDPGRWADYLLLGLAAGLMGNAKYNGVLLVICVVAANWRLLLQPKLYVAGLLALALLLPHLYWQYLHDWPSFRYHLQERQGLGGAYLRYQSEFLLNLLVIVNPFLLPYFYRVLWRRMPDPFDRSLRYVLIGLLLFFFYQAFGSHVQPQWMIITYLPLLVLAMRHWEPPHFPRLRRAAWFSLLPLAAIHLFLAVDLLPFNDLEIHGQEAEMARVHAAAQGDPVVFLSSYQQASLYGYYQDAPHTRSFNTATNRKNQFNLWLNDTLLHGREVLIVGGTQGNPFLDTEYDGFFATRREYLCYEHVAIEPLQWQILGDSIQVTACLRNPYPFPVHFERDGIRLQAYYYLHGRKWIEQAYQTTYAPLGALAPGDTLRRTVTFAHETAGAPEGFGLTLQRSPWPPAAVVKRVKMRK